LLSWSRDAEQCLFLLGIWTRGRIIAKFFVLIDLKENKERSIKSVCNIYVFVLLVICNSFDIHRGNMRRSFHRICWRKWTWPSIMYKRLCRFPWKSENMTVHVNQYQCVKSYNFNYNLIISQESENIFDIYLYRVTHY
jgi:hypothetical protein